MSVLPTGNNHSRIIVLKDFIKELDLTEEEREAFRKARSQVQTHSRLGALAGALAGGYFSICMGTITLGSQIGFFTGTAAGLHVDSSALSDEFTPDGRNLGDTADEQSSWAKYRPTPTPSRQQQSSSPQHDDNNSSWDKIRANNPSSTWDKIRQNNTSEQQQQNPTFNNESSNESIPRTREDFEELQF
ncbi:14337_t:CDS:2 [Rhizophagus irregularis]|nr:14337_t:CDS:2 [Rhizophagus irregularis]